MFVDAAGDITITGQFEGVIDLGGGPLSALGASGPYTSSCSWGAFFVAKYDFRLHDLLEQAFDSGSAIIDCAGGVIVSEGGQHHVAGLVGHRA